NRNPFTIGQRPTFRKDVDVVSPIFDSLAYDLLCLSPSVEWRGVDPVDSFVQGGADRLDGRFFVLGSPPDSPLRGRAYRSSSYSDFGNLEIALAKTSSLKRQSRSNEAGLKNDYFYLEPRCVMSRAPRVSAAYCTREPLS